MEDTQRGTTCTERAQKEYTEQAQACESVNGSGIESHSMRAERVRRPASAHAATRECMQRTINLSGALNAHRCSMPV